MEDSESASQLALWETILKLLVTVENASNFVNLPTRITPKFLDLLRCACSGNANKIGPLIISFVRLLRDYQENEEKKRELDRQEIEAIFQGLLSRSVSNSSSEASALSKALFQILDYIIKGTQDYTHVSELLQTTVLY